MNRIDRLQPILYVLPGEIRRSLSMLPDIDSMGLYEIVLRVNKPVTLVCKGGNKFIGSYGRVYDLLNSNCLRMSGYDMRNTFMSMCESSIYSFMDNINAGFITLPGGFRVGVCGRFIRSNMNESSLRDVSSLTIRIADEYLGVSLPLMQIYEEFGLGTTLIAGAPCSGKTTFLRDVCRNLSNGIVLRKHKVSLIDERCEISGPFKDDFIFDIGDNTDVYCNYDKPGAILMSVRTMSPDVIILDELGNVEETKALLSGMNSGVEFVFSVHANSKSDLTRKEQYIELEKSVFIKYLVFLDRDNPGRIKEVIINEGNNNCTGSSDFPISRLFNTKEGQGKASCNFRAS